VKEELKIEKQKQSSPPPAASILKCTCIYKSFGYLIRSCESLTLSSGIFVNGDRSTHEGAAL